MAIKTTLAAANLICAPTLASAYFCEHARETADQALSCAEGTEYDPKEGACVPLASS